MASEAIVNYEIVFALTSAISLFALVVFVFGFIRLREPRLKHIFRMYFMSSLMFSVSQVVLLVSTVIKGFEFDLFININSFFTFILAILMIATIMSAEKFSRTIISEGKNGP